MLKFYSVGLCLSRSLYAPVFTPEDRGVYVFKSIINNRIY